MNAHHISAVPAGAMDMLKAAERAARAIPPAFPLAATVAVNPFLGQSAQDVATASNRLSQVAGARLFRERGDYARLVEAGDVTEDDLQAALDASPHGEKPGTVAQLKAWLARPTPQAAAQPTIADLAAHASGTDWPDVIKRCMGLWAAGYFDAGQALWTPAPGKSAYSSWRDWAIHDLSPEIAGLHNFCAHVAAQPDTPERMILRATERLGLSAGTGEVVFHRLLMDVGGWAQHARWLLWKAEQNDEPDATLNDILAIRLAWEEALLEAFPSVEAEWASVVPTLATSAVPTADDVVDAIFQEAAERAFQRKVSAALHKPVASNSRPALQAAFCIDVRSEVFRRALEGLSGEIETIGFAGFFGLPVAHRAAGVVEAQAHLPVLLKAQFTSRADVDAARDTQVQIKARATRAWHRFRQAAVSSFAFVESAGPLYGFKIVKDALGFQKPGLAQHEAPKLDPALTPDSKAPIAAAVLKAMGFAGQFARLVLLVGHGASMRNNPHQSAYHCGACGGQTGDVSARLLARLLNDPETRAGLAARGVDVPQDTRFIAGLHDTVTDVVTLHEDERTPDHQPDIAQAKTWLARAGAIVRTERARRLPHAAGHSLPKRARNWAEVRPEWGLAGCAAFIAAPRSMTRGSDLAGRAFLHSYDWRSDKDFSVLELILTAPVVVASWISLQYFGSSAAPHVFGGGNKLIHNVVGGIGVLEGNGGVLRTGLPLQAVHDGAAPAHDALRLSVFVEAPVAAISRILARHEGVRTLFDNGWLHLLALEEGRVVARYRPGLEWDAVEPLRKAA